MKKILLFALLCVMTFTACSSKENANDNSKTNTGTTETGSVSEYTEDSYEDSFIGYNTDSNYENFFIGLKAELPDDWVIYNNREILEVNGLESVPTADELVPGIQYTDLIAYSTAADSYDSVVITFTKDEEGKEVSTADLAAIKLDEIIDTLEMGEHTDIKAEVTTTEFLGTDCDSIKANALLDGTNVTYLYVYTIIDGKTVTVEIASYDEAGAYELLASITKAE